MPLAVFKAVREVSSENSVHRAENLLKGYGKKWKTNTVGEKSAYVILELEGPCKITGIDIGNEHSAFVEVLVGKAGCAPENFTEILLTCSFMTPAESKSSSIPNRVRCFNREALVESAVDENWQVVKVICTQPFNKHVQYGLSFIKIHIAEGAAVKKDIHTKTLVPEIFLQSKSNKCGLGDVRTTEIGTKLGIGFGKFTLREESPDSDSESTTELFKRWNMSRIINSVDKAPTTSEDIRQASADLRRISESGSSKVPLRFPFSKEVHPKQQSLNQNSAEEAGLDRNREQLVFGDDDEINESVKQRGLKKQIEADRKRLRQEEVQANKQKRKSADKIEVARAIEGPSVLSKKRLSSPSDRPTKKIKRTGTVQYRPFNQLLRGVVLVISGIQNPDRANLRSKAIAMGAKYKADWDPGCTHLICAFKNTPKYNQVKGKGKIIVRSWIEKCFAEKKYLPWRRYALDSVDLGQPESDTEICNESLKHTIHDSDSEDEQPSGVTTKSGINVEPNENGNNSLGKFNLRHQHLNYTHASSGSDTEDEIQRIVEKKNSSLGKTTNQKHKFFTTTQDRDIYEVTTDEEDFLKDKLEFEAKQENFFKNVKIYICKEINPENILKLENIIKKYGGQVTNRLSEAHYVLAEQLLNKTEAIEVTGETVRPEWVYECNDREKKVSTSPYFVEIGAC